MKGKQHIEGIYKCYEHKWGTNFHKDYIKHVRARKHDILYVLDGVDSVYVDREKGTVGNIFGRGLDQNRIEIRRNVGAELELKHD